MDPVWTPAKQLGFQSRQPKGERYITPGEAYALNLTVIRASSWYLDETLQSARGSDGALSAEIMTAMATRLALTRG